MAFKLPKKTARSAKPAELTVREALADMGWKSDAALMREALGPTTVREALADMGSKSAAELMREAVEGVSCTNAAKVAAQVREQEEAARLVPKIPAPMFHREMFDGPRELAALRKEVVKLQTLLVATSSPPVDPPQPTAQAAPEQVQPAAGAKVGSAHRPSDDDLLQELERQRARKMRGALQRTADHFGLDRSMVGKACKRAEKARAAKYGKNLVPPNDPLSSAWHGTYEMGKKVKTPTH